MDCSPPVSSVHGIFRQEYWSGSPCRPPGDLPDPEIEPRSPVSPALWADSLPPEPSGRFPASCCNLENLTQLFAHPTQCSRFCKLSSTFLMAAGKFRSGVSQGLSAFHPTSPLHSSAGSPFSLVFPQAVPSRGNTFDTPKCWVCRVPGFSSRLPAPSGGLDFSTGCFPHDEVCTSSLCV